MVATGLERVPFGIAPREPEGVAAGQEVPQLSEHAEALPFRASKPELEEGDRLELSAGRDPPGLEGEDCGCRVGGREALRREPERRDQLLPLLMAHRTRCLKDEPGTLQFEVLVSREDDTKVLLYEVYRDDAAFDVHLNGPHIERVREEAAGMILKLYGTRCSLVE